MSDKQHVRQTRFNPRDVETVCMRVTKRSRLISKATGRKNSENQSEYQCNTCGATAWRSAYRLQAPSSSLEQTGEPVRYVNGF